MKAKEIVSQRPTEIFPIPIGIAVTLLLSRFLEGDEELAGAIVTIGLSVLPGLITFINERLKEGRRNG